MKELIGLKIKSVRLLSVEELEIEGWELDSVVACIEISDGTLIYAAQDEEGNGPGALFLQKDKKTFSIF